jgi:hypothetical protein
MGARAGQARIRQGSGEQHGLWVIWNQIDGIQESQVGYMYNINVILKKKKGVRASTKSMEFPSTSTIRISIASR